MAHLKQVGLQTVKIPSAGLGSYQSPPGEVEKSIEWALEAGVRLIDTAYIYRNEKEIGGVIKDFIEDDKVNRKDLFIVTKLPLFANRPELVEEYFNYSLNALQLDYLDLYLIHSPFGVVGDPEKKFIKFDEDMKVVYERDTDLIAMWREMEKLVDSGKVRSIGVSNFSSVQIEKISKIARIPIAVNQVECHAYFQQKKLRSTMGKWGIKLMAFAPLGSPGRMNLTMATILENPVVLETALAHSKTPAQILLRYLVQCGITVIPKSVKEHRIKENFNIFDFNLSPFEMAKLNSLDQGTKGRTFNLKFLKSDEDPSTLPEYPFQRDDHY